LSRRRMCMRSMVLEIECFHRRDVFFFLEVSPSSGRVLLFLTRPRPNVYLIRVYRMYENNIRTSIIYYYIYFIVKRRGRARRRRKQKGKWQKKKQTDHATGQYNTAYTCIMHIAYILSYTLIPIYKCIISGVPKIH